MNQGYDGMHWREPDEKCIWERSKGLIHVADNRAQR